MQPASASSALLAVGIIAGEIVVAAAGQASPPDWIKVTPRGEAATRDGRRYHFDPEALAARFSADAVDIAVDCDHAIALKASQGERVDAIGYAHALQARPDGTYAQVSWLQGGRAVLAAKTHRYVSPTFYPDEAGRAVWLHSIALVAAPALSMPALAHASHSPEPFMKQIAKALGLPETADEAACLAALKTRPDTKTLAVALGLAESADAAACLAAAGKANAALKPLAKALGLPEGAGEAACLSAIGALKGGGNELISQLQTQLATTSTQLQALQAGVRGKEIAELLDGGLKTLKISPAQREHLEQLCATDDGLTSVRAMLAATVPGLQPSGLDGAPAPGAEAEPDPVTLAAAAQRIQDERAAAGQPIGFAEAVALAQARPAKAA